MNAFIRKLKKKETLKLGAPSNNLKQAYQKKAETSLRAAKILLETGFIEEPVNLAYYSMYYATLSLLYAVGITCKNHVVAIILLDALIDEKELSAELSRAKQDRVHVQYYTDVLMTTSTVQEHIISAEQFILLLTQKTRSLDEKRIIHLRKIFDEL